MRDIVRNAVQIHVSTIYPKSGGVLEEMYFVEIVDYSYLGKSLILDFVTINQILELDKYIKTGESEKFEKTYKGGEIPEDLKFYINHVPKPEQ